MPAKRPELAAAFARRLITFGGSLGGLALLASCGGGGSEVATAGALVSTTLSTPFVRDVQVNGVSVDDLASVRYTIAAKPGSASRPVSVTFSRDALVRRGKADSAIGRLTLPVFGLYANHANQVAIDLLYTDGSTQTVQLEVDTESYSDPNALYDHPNVLQARAPGSALGFDYIALKGMHGTPVVIDTDGAIRWAMPAVIDDSTSSAFRDNGFEIGGAHSTVLTRIELDGTVSQTVLNDASFTAFHHNIDHGKSGLLVEVNRTADGIDHQESTLAEVNPDGTVIHEWDFAAILTEHMRSRGDDPAAFVRPGTDWFHMNASAYDPNDDSIIASSRENFVVKVDYQSGAIKWLLGDPSKYWFSFPSLREKAISLPAADLYPIGQHAISVTAAGELMLFNNVLGSLNQPAGAAAGASRDYSAVSTYHIDAGALTAHEVARFDHGQTILSDICSSAYEVTDRSLLLNYAVADNRTHTRVIGLDAGRQVVFDLEYPTTLCGTSWNAVPVPLEQMEFR